MHCKQLVSLSVASLMLAAVLTGCGGASSTASVSYTHLTLPTKRIV